MQNGHPFFALLLRHDDEIVRPAHLLNSLRAVDEFLHDPTVFGRHAIGSLCKLLGGVSH